jgi:hypothetical protein
LLKLSFVRAFKIDFGLPYWLRKKGGVTVTDSGIYLPTLEGSMLALPSDWIICGTQGEVYPCKPEIFAEIYEAVNE